MIKVFLQPAMLEIIQPFGHAEGRPVIIEVRLNIADTVLGKIISREDLVYQAQPESLFSADPVGKLYLDCFGMPELMGQEEWDGTTWVKAIFPVREGKYPVRVGQPAVDN